MGSGAPAWLSLEHSELKPARALRAAASAAGLGQLPVQRSPPDRSKLKHCPLLYHIPPFYSLRHLTIHTYLFVGL